ncbi:MAG: flagellar hook-length control protein FliK [Spirochaetia bacterium]|nr:flagellar hook-length control protein FliK [Spirochaetia bacterium]
MGKRSLEVTVNTENMGIVHIDLRFNDKNAVMRIAVETPEALRSFRLRTEKFFSHFEHNGYKLCGLDVFMVDPPFSMERRYWSENSMHSPWLNFIHPLFSDNSVSLLV